MSDASLGTLVRELANDTMKASAPSNLLYGIVTQAYPRPLEITVEGKLVLTKPFIVLSRNVTEYEVEMTVDHETEDTKHRHQVPLPEGMTTTDENTHRHKYKGRKKFFVHNQLLEGERVILAQPQGGQSYIVLDRLGKDEGL
jgi:hypothetical protein